MSIPISNFSFFPLSGKAPLQVDFLNHSKNLGGNTLWNSCPIGENFLYSNFNTKQDLFYLDFSGISSVNSKYGKDGLIISCGPTTLDDESLWDYGDHIINYGNKWVRLDKIYSPKSPTALNYKGVWDSTQNLPKLGNNGQGGLKGDYYLVNKTGKVTHPGEVINKHIESVSIDCSKNFSIEMVLNKFNSFHSIIQLYFHNLKVDVYDVNPGIHINTIDENNDRGFLRGINNYGSTVPLKNIIFPAVFKLEKIDNTLSLYINNEKAHSIAANLMGLNQGIRKLRLNVSTHNDVPDWAMHIKSIYIINNNMPNSCLGSSASFLWDFDDGTTSTEEQPKHVFKDGKVYKIKLTTTTENGSHSFTKNIFIDGNGNPVENANLIFQELKNKFVRNIDDIPDYCSNSKLKQIINTAIYDAVKHADDTKNSVTSKIKLSFSAKVDDKRDLQCETSFISGLCNDNINETYVRRTFIQPYRQQDIINGFFEFEQPTE